MQGSLTSEEINILLGRRQELEEFEQQMRVHEWSEKEWQDFFDRQQWVFGYGLDYRIMRNFGRMAQMTERLAYRVDEASSAGRRITDGTLKAFKVVGVRPYRRRKR